MLCVGHLTKLVLFSISDESAIKKDDPDDAPLVVDRSTKPSPSSTCSGENDLPIVKPVEKMLPVVDRSTKPVTSSTENVHPEPTVALTANNTQSSSSSSAASSTLTSEPSSSSNKAVVVNRMIDSIFVPAAIPKDAELPEHLLKLIELVLDEDDAFDELMDEIMVARWKAQRKRRGNRMSRSFSGESSAVRGCEISRIPVRVSAGDAERRKTIAITSTLNTTFIQ